MDFLINGFSVMGIVLGLTEVFKRAFRIPKRIVPLMSLVFGIALFVFNNGLSAQSFLVGMVIGLASSGLYSGGKAVMGK